MLTSPHFIVDFYILVLFYSRKAISAPEITIIETKRLANAEIAHVGGHYAV